MPEYSWNGYTIPLYLTSSSLKSTLNPAAFSLECEIKLNDDDGIKCTFSSLMVTDRLPFSSVGLNKTVPVPSEVELPPTTLNSLLLGW